MTVHKLFDFTIVEVAPHICSNRNLFPAYFETVFDQMFGRYAFLASVGQDKVRASDMREGFDLRKMNFVQHTFSSAAAGHPAFSAEAKKNKHDQQDPAQLKFHANFERCSCQIIGLRCTKHSDIPGEAGKR